MVQINFAQKSVTVKIVYYGPGMSGKTTNLEVVHQRAPESNKGDLTSISTDGDRTLFFDFMPLDLGMVAGMRTQFQIYTVPGQVYYNSTRKLVLQGVDGVIFIADSGASMLEENLESLANLAENLLEYGKDIATIPMVIQYNKRDLPDAMTVEELEKHLNPHGAPSFEAIASSGQGVFPTLKSLAASVLDTIHEQTGSNTKSQGAAPAPLASKPAPPAPIPQAPAAQAAPMLAPVAPRAPAAAPAPQPAAPIPAPVAQQQPALAQAPPAQGQAPQALGVAPLSVAPMPAGNAAPAGGLSMAPAPGAAPAGGPALRIATPDGSAGLAPAAPAAAPSMAPAPAAAVAPAPYTPQAAPPPPSPAPYAPAAPTAPAPMMGAAPQVTAAPAAAAAPVPGPRAGAPAPAGRLRPRQAPAPPVSSTKAGGGKAGLITAIVVIVALAAGIAIGGTVFNLI